MIDQRTTPIDLSGPAIDLDSGPTGSRATSTSEMNLKNQLQLYLDFKEMSATQLAKKSGVSKQVLSLWLSGGSPRNVTQLKKVAEVLQTTVDHLCFGDGLQKPAEQFQEIPADDFFSGIFEIKVRRVVK